MRFWFARQSEVGIRDQLVTQVVLGILSGELSPGGRLPSTRELARRFRIHPNTISAGYRQLVRDNWIEFRRGSGVFVRRSKPEVDGSPQIALDRLIAEFFRATRESKLSLPSVRSRLLQYLELQPPDHYLLIEPDEELRKIVASEMAGALTFPVKSCGLKDLKIPEEIEGAIPVVLPSKAAAVRQVLPMETDILTLKVHSVPSSLASWLPAPDGALLGVTSRWPDFLKLARTMLLAAGFHPDALVFRDARQPNWQRGLKDMTAVVSDSLTACDLPKGCRAIPFALLAESSIAELRRHEESITG